MPSLSLEESKKNGLFVSPSYVPITSRIKLKYHADSVEFVRGWVENSWIVNSDICLFKRIEKKEGYNLTIEFKKYPSDIFNFQLNGYGVGWGMGQAGKTVTIERLYDTLVFQIVEKNPDPAIGWKEELDGAQIKFIKAR